MHKTVLSMHNVGESALFLRALFFVLMIQGIVPFFLTSTLGQALWTTGFAQSFLNDSVFSIYACNIGAPEPAAIVFGLAGAWPTAVFMKIGLQAADADSAMTALWTRVSFISRHIELRDIFRSSGFWRLFRPFAGPQCPLCDGLLASGTVALDSAVSDIEVRVYVGPEDGVRLEGYELVLIESRLGHPR